MSQQGSISAMISALERFRDVLDLESDREDVDLESVLDGYLLCRGELARAVRLLADEQKSNGSMELAATADKVQQYLRSRLGDSIPSRYLGAGDPGRTRSALLAYLMRNVNCPVPAGRLRAISGDQTHTERRVRELRDYGYEVESTVRFGERCYVLRGDTPNTVDAAWRTVQRNVESDKKLPPEIRQSLEMIIREKEATYRVADHDSIARLGPREPLEGSERNARCPQDV